MQALKERISSKLSDKSKSKDKDGSSTLKSSSSVDGKHSTLHDSHHTSASASASALPTSSSGHSASSSAIHIQSAEKGIGQRYLTNDFFFVFFFFFISSYTVQQTEGGREKSILSFLHVDERSSVTFSVYALDICLSFFFFVFLRLRCLNTDACSRRIRWQVKVSIEHRKSLRLAISFLFC